MERLAEDGQGGASRRAEGVVRLLPEPLVLPGRILAVAARRGEDKHRGRRVDEDGERRRRWESFQLVRRGGNATGTWDRNGFNDVG